MVADLEPSGPGFKSGKGWFQKPGKMKPKKAVWDCIRSTWLLFYSPFCLLLKTLSVGFREGSGWVSWNQDNILYLTTSQPAFLADVHEKAVEIGRNVHSGPSEKMCPRYCKKFTGDPLELWKQKLQEDVVQGIYFSVLKIVFLGTYFLSCFYWQF